MENNQENIPPVIQPQITKQLNKKLIVLIIIALVGLASVYIIYPKSITSCGVLPDGPSCAKYVCWGIPMQGVGAPLCWGKLKLIGPTTPTQQVASKDVIYGQVAEDVCGPQPPVLCQANMRLGCRVADKKWGCYPFSSETDVSWEIYRDETNGFEFQYPKNWIVEITGNKTLKNSLLIGPSGVDDRAFIMQALSLDISDSSKYSSLKNFAEQQAGREHDYVEKITLENTLINNIPAIKIRSDDKSDYIRTVFIYEGKAFLLHDSGNFESESNEFKNILSTFKFISSTTQSSIIIPPLLTDINWQEIPFDSFKTMDFQMAYDDFKYVQEPARRKQKIIQLPGHLWTSSVKNLSDSQLNDTSEKFQKYYGDFLKISGWDWEQSLDEKHISFQGPSAAGALGSVWGYVKIQNGKLRLVGLSYHITDYTDISNGGPIEIKCPCTLELKVFVSDEVSVNNFSL